MPDDNRSELQRAFDNLNEGVRSLLGLGRTNPILVDDLLERPPVVPPRAHRVSEPRRTVLRIAGTARSERPKANYLSLVK